ncbi:Serine/threonine-protein phosphatase [Daphnia magna]|uniref:Serine/threonine-protein phosphatase n=1 Tax=Daphnia magna TaxID=35525 RepID=A0A162RAQ4_9CRUS|nr:Serine/threonine-protein phosphatase [Daphnia magna]
MLRSKRKYSLVDRLIARHLMGHEINDNLFSDWCGKSHSLYRRDLLAHFGCVNAVEFSEDGTIFASGGDDRRVLLWSISETLDNHSQNKPVAMEAEHGSNVFCLAISVDNERIFSGGNDLQTIIHDTKSSKPVDYFLHENPVYGVSLQPSSQSVFATACDDGKLRVFDMRCSVSAEIVLASKRSPFHSIMFHPIEGRIVASASAKDGPELWDLRNPLMCLRRYPYEKGAMSVRFNSLGDKLLCIRRREPPKVYHLYRDEDIQLRADGYSNACTMKSCCFAGDRDEFAIAGSDDHNIYIWRIPATGEDDPDHIVHNAHMVLKGHRSIVNHVRYNSVTCSLASCGVEKMIKIWSPFSFPGSSGGLDRLAADEIKPRKRLSRLSRDCNMIIAPSPNFRTTDEDKKMLAFFDLLVDRSSWISSGEDETSDSPEDDDIDDDDDQEYSTSHSSSLASSENEESFEINSLSTPSTSSSDDEEPVAGPSGTRVNSRSESESLKLELPLEFNVRRRVPLRLSELTSSSDNDETYSPVEKRNQDPVVFRSSYSRNRQFRQRISSSSSSSS